MEEFLRLNPTKIEDIIYNTLSLFKENDLGSQHTVSISEEIKKPEEDGDVERNQFRMRFHGRFNIDLNNIYVIEVPEKEKGKRVVETSVNVYHDSFENKDFNILVKDIFEGTLSDVNVDFIFKRFDFNFNDKIKIWKAAEERKFIIDPELDKKKAMYNDYKKFLELAKKEAKGLLKNKINEILQFLPDISLKIRKFPDAKSRILKIFHKLEKDKYEMLMKKPHFFSILLLEYCLIPLHLINELYVMSLIYNRDFNQIRDVAKKRIEEII